MARMAMRRYRHVSGLPLSARTGRIVTRASRSAVRSPTISSPKIAAPLAADEPACPPQRRTQARRITEDGVMTVSSAIWRDQLTDSERATLGRGDGVITDPRPDVLVVGGGILGVATAAACHQAGLGSVLLVETGRLGAVPPGGGTGLLIREPPQWSAPEPFVDLERPAWSAGVTSSRRC